MKLQTSEISIQKSSETVYNFFSDFNNFKKILPSTITNWEADSEHCSFTFDGKIKMAMKFEEKKPNTYLKIIHDGKSPIDYSLICEITPVENNCKVKITLDAKLNPFMKMMVEKPLTKFVSVIEEKVKEIFG